MKKHRLAQFFENDAGQLSMTRLVVFLTLPPSTWVVLQDYDQLGVYLGTYVAGYAAGKAADAFTKEKEDV